MGFDVDCEAGFSEFLYSFVVDGVAYEDFGSGFQGGGQLWFVVLLLVGLFLLLICCGEGRVTLGAEKVF